MKRFIVILALTLLSLPSVLAALPEVEREDGITSVYRGGSLFIAQNGHNSVGSFHVDLVDGDDGNFYFWIHSQKCFAQYKAEKEEPVSITFMNYPKDIIVKGTATMVEAAMLCIPHKFSFKSDDKGFSSKTAEAKREAFHVLLVKHPIKSFSIAGKEYTLQIPPSSLAVKTTSDWYGLMLTIINNSNRQFSTGDLNYKLFKSGLVLTAAEIEHETFTFPGSKVEWQACNLGAKGDPFNVGTRVSLAEAKRKCPAGWRLPTPMDFVDLLYNCDVKYITVNGVKMMMVDNGGTEYMVFPYSIIDGTLWTDMCFEEYGMQCTGGCIEGRGGGPDEFLFDVAPIEGGHVYVRYVRDKK